MQQAVTELALEAARYSALPPGGLGPDPEYAEHLMSAFLYARAKSIWGGSNEI